MRASEISPKKLVVFDIDDTLVHTQTKVHVVKDGEIVDSLNSHDFTHYRLKPGEEFDFGDFRNAREFFEKSKPIIPMMNQLKRDIATGNKVVMVTARADFDDKELFLDTFRKFGIDMGKVHVYRAGNSKEGTTEERKKAIIKNLLDKDDYSKAIMYDDAKPNLHTFMELKKDHPRTKFYAWHVSLEGEASEYMREDLEEKWSEKYKRSINCSNPKGFSQKAHCAGRKKNEDVPQPGESSGKAKQFVPGAKIQTREMTLDQILSSVEDIPYVNNVVDDWDAKDYSWGVTKKVIEYARYLQKNPQSVANLPPLVVIDGRLDDGAHRLSAVNLLQKRMDPKNPLWKQVKLKVNFGASNDVAEAVDPGRRKFLQRTAGAAAMAAAPKQTLGAIGKISQQAANVAKAASTNATLRALGAAAVQAVVAHHKEFGGEIGPRNYDGDDSGYWDGTDADWNPSVNPTESPFGPSRVKQTVSGRTFLKIETGFSGDDIILTFLNDKGQPSWVRVDWVGAGQLSVKDVNVPGMKEVDPYDISDILEYGFDEGMTTDPDEPEEYSDKFRFPSYMRDGKEYEFLVDLLASGATSSNSGLKFAKKNPKWVEIASQYSSDDDYGDDNNTAKSAVADVAKSAATSGVRTQTIAGGLTAFKELVNRVLDKTNINRKKDEPAVKDMGRIEPTSSAQALPAPDRSAADIMAQLRDVVGRDLTQKEREVARQEVGRKS